MNNFSARRLLPKFISTRLWGDRDQWGLIIDKEDPCWREWLSTYENFYTSNQRSGIGEKVNDAGYQIMSEIDLQDRCVLEVGAGDIRHLCHCKGFPSEYILADIAPDMMKLAEKKLYDAGIVYRSLHVTRGQSLAIENESVDVVVTFYSLEHIYPLDPYLQEIHRILKPGGLLIGAIPAEGGLAWGLGRYLTSRKWFKKNTNIDPDKIICWEHPNFADKILSSLDKLFERKSIEYWPIKNVPWVDINLVIKFIYTK